MTQVRTTYANFNVMERAFSVLSKHSVGDLSATFHPEMDTVRLVVRASASGDCTKDTCPASASLCTGPRTHHLQHVAPELANVKMNRRLCAEFGLQCRIPGHICDLRTDFLPPVFRLEGMALVQLDTCCGWVDGSGWSVASLFHHGPKSTTDQRERPGYVGRILLHNDPFSDIGFKLNIVLLTIAPAFLSAGIYLTLKKITLVFGPGLSLLSPPMYAWIFVACDGVSITLQGAGGAISAIAESQSLLNMGVDIMTAGLAFQVFTLLIFFVLAAGYFVRCLRNPEKLNTGSAMLARSSKFQFFVAAVVVAFFCIFTRCCYRVAELSGGWGNSIMRDEAGFIICDSE